MKDFFKRVDVDELALRVENKNAIKKFFMLMFGIFISALSFNLFYVPNNFVGSGLSGIAIILSFLVKIRPSFVILIGNLFFAALSFLTLGWKKSIKYVIGAFLYTGMVYLTEGIPSMLHFSFDNILLYVIAAGVTSGFAESFIYKAGFSSGGTSILALIISEHTKKPLGQILRSVGVVIVLAGGITFGYTMIMYSLIITFISTALLDKFLIGISDSKMFWIQTSKQAEVEDFVIEVISSGVTIFDSKGAFSNRKKKMLMCVVPTEKYSYLKNAIQEIDPYSFIIVSDCYEVLGGTKKVKNVI